MSEISLSKIGFFNPGRLSDREIELGFIARQGEYQFLLDNILAHDPGEVPQHFILIGQRGMGKTSLLLRVAVELKKAPHKQRFIPLQYPEEQYNIDRLSKFWLNSLDALADALDLEGKKEESRELDLEIKKLTQSNPPEVYPVFKEWMKKVGRCPVLMVDNLNLIFDKISTEDQHRLRAILTSEGAPILVGASATSIKQTTEYGEPFYDAFQIKYLKKLSLDESIEVLKNLAQITGKPLHATFAKNRGRIATFHQLTGGTPRTLSMLFPLISDGFSEEIQSDLNAILDIITPLYKARFEELSDQMQVIMDAIALHWDPIALEDIRNVTQLENAKLSPQLKRLTDVGWIQRANPGRGKGALYEVSERFFNVWYLMRRSSRRQKRELYCLSKFLEVFYGESLDTVAGNRLTKENMSVNDAYLNLALAEVTNTEETRTALQAISYKTLLAHSQTHPEILKEFSVPEDQITAEVRRQYDQALAQIEAGDFNKALEIAEALIKIDPEVSTSHFLYAYLLERKGLFKEAEMAYIKATQLDEKFAHPWYGLGNLYKNHLNQFEKAEKAYKKASQLDENDADPWNGLGNLYQGHLNQFEEAEKAYKKAIQLDQKLAHPWNGLGNLYKNHLNQFEDAEMAYKKASQLDEKDAYPWNALGNLYQNHLNQFEKAEMAYKKASQLDEKFAHPWNGLGNLYKDHLNQFEKAEMAYKKASQLDEKFAHPWYGLGNLYQNHLNQFEDAEMAYKKAIQLDEKFAHPWNGLGNLYKNHLNQFEEAEKAYKKASQLDENDADPWYGLGNLYKNHLNQFEKAEKAYKKAIQLDEKFAYPWNGLGNLYQGHLNQFEKAEKAYKKAIQLDEKLAYPWNGLGKLYKDHLNQFEDAEKAFTMAISLGLKDAWNTLGNLRMDHLQKYEEAEDAYLEGLKEDISVAAYNLAFLYTDKLDKQEKAAQILSSITTENRIRDTHLLLEALFAYRAQNAGIAREKLVQALEFIGDTFPSTTQDDWWRAGAMAVKLGHGDHFLEVLRETGHDIILRPYYEAIRALMAKDSEGHFTTVAAEVREPAAKILEFMKRYIS